jgi:protein mraZ
MLMGEYHHSIDEKKRIIIPSRFREELKDTFVITRGIENCLFIYSLEEWKKITDKLETLPFTKKDARQFIRFFLSGATEAQFDKQGRIVITTPLLEYAKIEKDCVIIGAGERLEIWSENAWNDFFNEASTNMSDIAENLFNGE